MVREPYTIAEGAIVLLPHGEEARALSAADDDMAALIAEVGEVFLDIDGDDFLALARAIVDQQLSSTAAAAIWKRFESLCGGRVTPAAILCHDEDQLRSVGLSYAKARSLRDLAQRTSDGSVDFEHLADLDDEEIIQILTRIRGIGRWTAQMFLIFSLGRPDVFATADGGLRRAVAQLKNLPADAPPELFEALAEDWAPYRTAASLYLWKALNNG
jgi:DNA-3-methyladenine glycosylase II